MWIGSIVYILWLLTRVPSCLVISPPQHFSLSSIFTSKVVPAKAHAGQDSAVRPRSRPPSGGEMSGSRPGGGASGSLPSNSRISRLGHELSGHNQNRPSMRTVITPAYESKGGASSVKGPTSQQPCTGVSWPQVPLPSFFIRGSSTDSLHPPEDVVSRASSKEIISALSDALGTSELDNLGAAGPTSATSLQAILRSRSVVNSTNLHAIRPASSPAIRPLSHQAVRPTSNPAVGADGSTSTTLTSSASYSSMAEIQPLPPLSAACWDDEMHILILKVSAWPCSYATTKVHLRSHLLGHCFVHT